MSLSNPVAQAFFAIQLLSIAALCLSECSVLAMILRLWLRTVDFKRWATCTGLLAQPGVGSWFVPHFGSELSSFDDVRGKKSRAVSKAGTKYAVLPPYGRDILPLF